MEHPTQALLDLYTIENETGSIAGVDENSTKVYTFFGDMKHSRTVHSLVKLLQRLPHVKLNFISPKGLEFPHELLKHVHPAQHLQHSHQVSANNHSSL